MIRVPWAGGQAALLRVLQGGGTPCSHPTAVQWEQRVCMCVCVCTRVYPWAGSRSAELSEDVMSARGAAPPRHSFCKQPRGHELHKCRCGFWQRRAACIQVTPGERPQRGGMGSWEPPCRCVGLWGARGAGSGYAGGTEVSLKALRPSAVTEDRGWMR